MKVNETLVESFVISSSSVLDLWKRKRYNWYQNILKNNQLSFWKFNSRSNLKIFSWFLIFYVYYWKCKEKYVTSTVTVLILHSKIHISYVKMSTIFFWEFNQLFSRIIGFHLYLVHYPMSKYERHLENKKHSSEIQFFYFVYR